MEILEHTPDTARTTAGPPGRTHRLVAALATAGVAAALAVAPTSSPPASAAASTAASTGASAPAAGRPPLPPAPGQGVAGGHHESQDGPDGSGREPAEEGLHDRGDPAADPQYAG